MPVSSVSVGVPVTVTDSLNATVTSITSPALYVPFDLVDVTFVTSGAAVSIIKTLFAPSEPAVPGAGRVSVASLPPPSWIVPPPSASALASTQSKSVLVSPAWTIYWNVSVAVPLPPL